MKLRIICMGKTRERFIQEGIQKYLRYLKPYTGIEILELKEERIKDLKEAPIVRKKEAEKIFKSLPEGTFLATLDERGEEFTSHEFAGFLNAIMESGTKEIVFVIGGAMGLDEKVTVRANKVIAMSRWTLTHEMARLVLLEQIYRAFTIIKGKTYHH
ncbi:MAG TPA: 23S rRNA (pseudouridine(1915)-N(3))-methyltransferase RlmH [Nitrospirota bacterium]|nr:23S rRNA (pseudouridine(1915)-N(3))-methyltransferase RlmH [Nitrospirota bacterium]